MKRRHPVAVLVACAVAASCEESPPPSFWSDGSVSVDAMRPHGDASADAFVDDAGDDAGLLPGTTCRARRSSIPVLASRVVAVPFSVAEHDGHVLVVAVEREPVSPSDAVTITHVDDIGVVDVVGRIIPSGVTYGAITSVSVKRFGEGFVLALTSTSSIDEGGVRGRVELMALDPYGVLPSEDSRVVAFESENVLSDVRVASGATGVLRVTFTEVDALGASITRAMDAPLVGGRLVPATPVNAARVFVAIGGTDDVITRDANGALRLESLEAALAPSATVAPLPDFDSRDREITLVSSSVGGALFFRSAITQSGQIFAARGLATTAVPSTTGAEFDIGGPSRSIESLAAIPYLGGFAVAYVALDLEEGTRAIELAFMRNGEHVTEPVRLASAGQLEEPIQITGGTSPRIVVASRDAASDGASFALVQLVCAQGEAP